MAGALAVCFVWLTVAAVNGLQNLLRAQLDFRSVSIGQAFSENLIFLAIWALGTPLILASARRFPIRAQTAVRYGALHLFFGSAFVLLLNALGITVLAAVGESGFDSRAVAQSTTRAFVHVYHVAIIVYLAIVAAGHVSWTRSPRRPSDGTQARENASPSIEIVRAVANGEKRRLEQIAIRKDRSTHLLPVDGVDWIEASGDHVIFHAGGERHRVRDSLKALHGRLDQRRFVRIHRSVIVNVTRVASVRPYNYGDLTVRLTTGRQLRVSRTRRRDLERALGRRL